MARWGNETKDSDGKEQEGEKINPRLTEVYKTAYKCSMRLVICRIFVASHFLVYRLILNYWVECWLLEILNTEFEMGGKNCAPGK